MDDQTRYEHARKRVQALKGFYAHLAVYAIVNTFMLVINLLTSPHALWFYWPLLGWGIGIAMHAAAVLGTGTWGKDWEARKVKELMDKGR